jgi:hypothetical protein
MEQGIRLLEEFIDGDAGLHVRSVVDEMPDRHARRELRHAAKMIAVPMRGDEMIDLRQAGLFGGGHDAIRISRRRRAAIARIDQQ